LYGLFDEVHQHALKLGSYSFPITASQVLDLLNQMFEIEFLEASLAQ
jgi:hypothetical protein